MGTLKKKFNTKARLSALLPEAMDTALKAGEILMGYYNQGVNVKIKGDGSPVTIADEKSSEYIVSRLQKLTPDIIVVSEENEDDPVAGQPFWVVDPLDATKEFINNTGGFKVKIALICDGEPLLGVVNSPVHKTLYYSHTGIASYKKEGENPAEIINTRKVPDNSNLSVLFDALHSDPVKYKSLCLEFNQQGLAMPKAPETSPGGLPRNLRVADGEYDMRIKTQSSLTDFGEPSSGFIWDSAPDKIILENAGGAMIRIQDGTSLKFDGPPRGRVPAYVAFGDKRLAKYLPV